MSSVLSVPLTDRRALVIPATPGWLWPGSEIYERIFGGFRGPRVDLYAVLVPFGIVPEQTLVAHPEVFVAMGNVTSREGLRTAALRTRAWLDNDGIGYTKVVFVVHGSVVPIWSAALRGTKGSAPLDVAERIELVRPNRQVGFRGTLMRRMLSQHLSFAGDRQDRSSP